MAARKPKEAAAPAAEQPTSKVLAQVVDKFYDVRQRRLELDRQANALKEEESALRQYLIDNLSHQEVTSISGKVGRVSLVPAEEYQIVDPDAFYEYVRKTKGFDLLQRRLAGAAVQERVEAGKKVPGVEAREYYKLSVGAAR